MAKLVANSAANNIIVLTAIISTSDILCKQRPSVCVTAPGDTVHISGTFCPLGHNFILRSKLYIVHD